jgi:hypothetical protein
MPEPDTIPVPAGAAEEAPVRSVTSVFVFRVRTPP